MRFVVRGGRRRLTTLCERRIIADLIKEARENGARLKQACEVVEITDRTYQRWVSDNKLTVTLFTSVMIVG